MPKSRIFNMENMSFNVIRENNILAKIYEFTVNTFDSLQMVKAAYSVTMNIFRKKNIFFLNHL